MTKKLEDIELRRVKIHQDMSEETTCFSADIYLAGKKCGKVSNNGQGAPHRYTDHEIAEWLSPLENEVYVSELVEKENTKRVAGKLARRFLRNLPNPERRGVLVGICPSRRGEEFIAVLDGEQGAIVLQRRKASETFKFDHEGNPR